MPYLLVNLVDRERRGFLDEHDVHSWLRAQGLDPDRQLLPKLIEYGRSADAREGRPLVVDPWEIHPSRDPSWAILPPRKDGISFHGERHYDTPDGKPAK